MQRSGRVQLRAPKLAEFCRLCWGLFGNPHALTLGPRASDADGWLPRLPSRGSSAALICVNWMLLSLCPAPAGVLFEDDFNRGMAGWTAVQPAGSYLDGPLRWQFDLISGGIGEQSNIYTDSATYSPTATAPMLINDTLTALNFTYTARLTAGDDDGFGLIFGYQNETNFYRVTFARQARTGGFPWTGWNVDRKVNGDTVNLFGAGTPGHVASFINTASRPFDVTISVDTSSRLTLAVVDNPTGVPTTYPLVTSQALPGPANGQVGVFTWGMSGGTPGGFRIQALNLIPASLAGNPDPVTDWTAVIPPRASGSTTLSSGQPAWSLAIGPAGAYGALSESGDCYAGNDATGQLDFTGPTLVAGSEAWTDYTFAARITPHDDDGHGILLRYKNSTNFYRIALRSQVSTVGAPTGLSVQKNVNRTYTEVYRDNPVKYSPVTDVPYDLVARMAGDTLEILLVADPEGAAQAYAYGPFTVTGVDSGMIGLFSWAMAQTDFDWVSVQDGVPLYVSSPLGSPMPAKGLSSFAPGTIVSASAGISSPSPGTRHSAEGWQGAGSVPASGAGSNVVFTISAFSRLRWLWRTEHRLAVTNDTGGTVSFSPGEWFVSGSSVTVEAVPDSGYAFAGWKGDSLSTAPELNLTMNQPYTLVATFTADTDADGLPDDWELASFGSLSATPEADSDGDGRSNFQEYQNGTDPTVPDIFRIEGLVLTNSSGLLTISNNTGSRFNVERAVSISGGWTTLATTQFANTFTASLPAGDQSLWRLSQPARPPEALPFVPGSWTLAVLPDTQVYAMNYPELFNDQTRWILANKDRYRIKYVLHLGDLTNNNVTNQWANAWAAMSLLNGQVPYALVPGNHDYGAGGGTADRSTYLNDYFRLTNYTAWPTFGGVMEPGRLDNSYHLFSAGGVDWLVLALEFGPRNRTVAWASQIASNFPARRKILITHAYTYNDDTRYDWAAKGSTQTWNPHNYPTVNDPDGTNDGEELWQKLVKVHPHFVMVLSGHVLNDGLGRLTSTNDFGEVVHQMLVNYQMKALGGEAVLRLVEFLPDGKTVQVKAYSPCFGTYKTDPQNQFVLTLQPALQ